MSAEAKTETKEKGKPPVTEVREGTVKLAIWERRSEKGTFYTAGQPQLSYQKDGQWHEGGSYSEFDLVDLMVAAAKAKSEIRKLRKAAETEKEEDGA